MELKYEKNRVVLMDGLKEVGFCSYIQKDDVWIIDHTVVDHEYQGQGLAKKLLYLVIDEARKKGKKIIPQCSYALYQFERDSDLQDLWYK